MTDPSSSDLSVPGDLRPIDESSADDIGQITDSSTDNVLQPGETIPNNVPQPTGSISDNVSQPGESIIDDTLQTPEFLTDDAQSTMTEPIIEEVDWSHYFDGLNGAAVIFDPAEQSYQIYHPDLALTRRSPCSTFKIISSLIALESDVIVPNDSTRAWSGEVFWNADWNTDLTFSDAFHSSCVWYFREVIDEIGKDRMQVELNRLSYGNCDISDWEGHLNTNNSNPALTGFWIESSLLISPKEQVEIMERIFGDHTDYSEETLNQLAQVMLLIDQDESELAIYGKTGMGKAYGIVVDAWFTGFADATDKRIYFCVYLGETDGLNVSSTRAKEIAIQIISEYLD